MTTTFDEFIAKWLGKKADFDGFYGGQCVDLYRFYVQEVLEFPQSPGVGGATEIWYSADPKYYDFIENTPTVVPVKGDIPIWDRDAGGGMGHVDIVITANTRSFVGLDQNWPTLSKVTKTTHNYDNVIGWLHPKNGGSNMATMYKMKSGKEVDLSNIESNKVLANVYDEVINQKIWTRTDEVDQKIKNRENELNRSHADEIRQINDSINSNRDQAVRDATDTQERNLRARLAEVLHVGAGEELSDLIEMVKNLKEQGNVGTPSTGTELEKVLGQMGYTIDVISIKKK